MNKRGQTLALFIIFIPIFIGLAALVMDTGLVISKKAHLKEVTKTAINAYFNKKMDEEKIKDLLIKNEISVDNLVLEIENNKIMINNEIDVDSIFGGLIGIKEYKIKLKLTGYQDNGKIIIE